MVRRLERIQLASKIRVCRKCKLSREVYEYWEDGEPTTRKVRPVPGEGPEDAKVVFVARNPGKTEDLENRPLVGASGTKVFAALLRRLNLKREQVGIINTVCCFTVQPYFNRAPEPAELKSCRSHLEAQVAFFRRRRVLIPMGREAAEWALEDPKVKITLVEGSMRRDLVVAPLVIPIRHPAAFLRDPSEAKKFSRLKLPRIIQAVKAELESRPGRKKASVRK